MARRSFAFQTTLASRSFAPWLKKLRADGFEVHLAFLSLPNPEMAIARVAERVREGGHDVPEDVVRRRFASGLSNFFTLHQGVADTWQLFDNSELTFHQIASSRAGQPPDIYDVKAWNNLTEQQKR